MMTNTLCSRIDNNEETNQSPTVAVFGCGPSGMFFLHALNYKKKMMEANGDVEGLARLPKVSCFERASEPGGVWRSSRDHAAKEDNEKTTEEEIWTKPGDDSTTATAVSEDELSSENRENSCCSSFSSGSYNISSPDEYYPDEISSDESSSDESEVEDLVKTSTNMYEALWMNGCKELLEFFDYTYEEHFGGIPLPAYMPRQHMLDYLLGRVTKGCPNFFDQVNFNTNVDWVKYLPRKKKFKVITTDKLSKTKSTRFFDKCIWAGGKNGQSYTPNRISDDIVKKGKFKGRVLHSSEAGNVLDKVKGKRILLIGDNLSSEDIALQAVKLGAEKVYVYSRSAKGICCDTGAWPMNKVEIIKHMKFTQVTKNGTGIEFIEAKVDYEDMSVEPVDGGNVRIIEDISFIIFCTGYDVNIEMLDYPLQELFEEESEHKFVDLPKDWRMDPNPLLEEIGHIEPHPELAANEKGVCALHFKGILISNPSMMYIYDSAGELPLLECELGAWYLLRYIMGEIQLPSAEERKEWGENAIIKIMQNPLMRSEIDCNWMHMIHELGKDHWCNQLDLTPQYQKLLESFYQLQVKFYARDMIEADYPFRIGTYEELNEKGEMMVKMHMIDDNRHETLNQEGDERNCKTFRDADPRRFISIHSGAVAAPLKTYWIDLNDENNKEVHMLCAA